MNILDCEKACICLALKYPESENLSQVFLHVSDDKFGNDNTIGHQVIWASLSEILYSNKLTTIDNLMIDLKKKNALDTVGGEVYLRSLYNYLSDIGVNTDKNWRQYAEIVHIAGTLRIFGKIISEYYDMYKDFDRLVSSTEDPQEFIFSFTRRIEKLFNANMPNEGYQPIANAVDKEREILDDINMGIKDFIIVGMPGLETYAVPYPRSIGIIHGLRSMGKTQFGLQLILGKARHLQLSGMAGECTINSLETPANLLVRRMACCEAKIDSRKLRLGELTGEEKERYNAKLDEIEKLPISYDDSPVLTTDQLTQRAIARHLIVKRVMGLSDYTELFADGRRDTEEQRVSRICKNIRNIAWTTWSAELLISQDNDEGLRNKFMIAGIDNTRNSKALSQITDWGVEIINYPQLLKSNFEPQAPEGMSLNYVWALIQKNKNGPLGKLSLDWTAEYTRMVDTTIQRSPYDMHKLFDFRNANDITPEVEESDSWY